MLRKVLVAIDGSEASVRVAQVVKELCLQASGNGNGNGHGLSPQPRFDVTLLHVVPPYLEAARADIPRIVEEMMDVDSMIRTVALRQGEAALAEAEKVLEEVGIYPEVRVSVGSPGESICEVAERGGYDLIVMGRRDLSCFQEMFTDRVSEYVLRHCRVPVLIVH